MQLVTILLNVVRPLDSRMTLSKKHFLEPVEKKVPNQEAWNLRDEMVHMKFGDFLLILTSDTGLKSEWVEIKAVSSFTF